MLLVGRDGIGWCANGTPYYIRCGGDRCAERSAKKGLCVSFWHLLGEGIGLSLGHKKSP